MRVRQSILILQAKRAAFEFQAPNKKAPSTDRAYNFRAAEAFHRAPVANRNTPKPNFEALRHEIIG